MSKLPTILTTRQAPVYVRPGSLMRLHVERPSERSLIVAMDVGYGPDTTLIGLYEYFQNQAPGLCGITTDMLEAQRRVQTR